MIVATVLLAIAIVAALACFNSVMRSTMTADRLHTAALLAQRRLSELELQSASLASGTQQGEFGAEFPGYRWQEVIEPTEFQNLLRVTLTVSWGSEGSPGSRDFVTFIRTDADAGSQPGVAGGMGAGANPMGNPGGGGGVAGP
jgi:hypothetical protein